MRILALAFLLLGGCSKGQLFEMQDLSYMEPAIKPGQIFWVEMPLQDEEISSLKRFDIVVVKDLHPSLDGEYAFRILGLPGDSINFNEDGVEINGTKLTIPSDLGYLDEGLRKTELAGSNDVDVPVGEYFLIGDNLDIAYDSRRFGSVDQRKVVGLVKSVK